MPAEYKPRASFAFSPQGNLYEKTLLQGLVFSYAARPAKDEAACFASVPANGSTASTATYNGRSFRELTGTNAGMCHAQTATLDVTYSNGACLLFERDFNTECNGAGDGKRALTTNETRALQYHLDAVMKSVVITP